jgi:drug/metabolite transporter (DMT)-like permease
MTASLGIALAFVAMLAWGFGDFLIQKSTRKVGDWETLFIITAFGVIVLLPFVYRGLSGLFATSGFGLWVLVSSGLILTCASLLSFEGFKKGKLAVVEPLLSFEIPAAAVLAFIVLHDKVDWLQIIMIILLMIGLVMVSFKEKRLSRSFFLEKGVVLFFSGAVLMGVSDFLLGWGSRLTDPVTANFILDLIMAVISGIFVLSHGGFRHIVRDISVNRGLALSMSISDNVAWLAYALAMTLVPIAIATGLAESSIIVGVVLAFAVNHEKLQRHQKIGLVVALTAAIILAAVTAG